MKKAKKTIALLLLALNCEAMENVTEDVEAGGESRITLRETGGLAASNNSILGSSPEVETYIPQHLDITGALENEGRICFCVSRWLLQPLNVIAPLVSAGLVAFGEYYIKTKPDLAEVLNGVGLGFEIMDFILSVLLIKVNNKLERIDEHIGNKKKQADQE